MVGSAPLLFGAMTGWLRAVGMRWTFLIMLLPAAGGLCVRVAGPAAAD